MRCAPRRLSFTFPSRAIRAEFGRPFCQKGSPGDAAGVGLWLKGAARPKAATMAAYDSPLTSCKRTPMAIRHVVPILGLAVALAGCGAVGAIDLFKRREPQPPLANQQLPPPVDTSQLPPLSDGSADRRRPVLRSAAAAAGGCGRRYAAASGRHRAHRSSRRLDDHFGWRFLPAVHDADELDGRLSCLDARLHQRPPEVDLGVEPQRQPGGPGQHGRNAHRASQVHKGSTASTAPRTRRALPSPSTASLAGPLTALRPTPGHNQGGGRRRALRGDDCGRANRRRSAQDELARR